MKFLLLEEVGSTNSYAAVHAAELDDMTMILADAQTSGRGQRGNSWEAEPGRNLTFTLFHTPEQMPAARQFLISEATALAVCDFLASEGADCMVKWPNDIYAGDRKICGILIENSLIGARIDHTRIGVGLNINQREFRSDAPNPVSLVQLTGRELDLSSASARLGEYLAARLRQASAYAAKDPSESSLHSEFLKKLYRNDGRLYPYRRREDGKRFAARIAGVDPAGPLLLLEEGKDTPEQFAFKEVEFLLP